MSSPTLRLNEDSLKQFRSPFESNFKERNRNLFSDNIDSVLSQSTALNSAGFQATMNGDSDEDLAIPNDSDDLEIPNAQPLVTSPIFDRNPLSLCNTQNENPLFSDNLDELDTYQPKSPSSALNKLRYENINFKPKQYTGTKSNSDILPMKRVLPLNTSLSNKKVNAIIQVKYVAPISSKCYTHRPDGIYQNARSSTGESYYFTIFPPVYDRLHETLKSKKLLAIDIHTSIRNIKDSIRENERAKFLETSNSIQNRENAKEDSKNQIQTETQLWVDKYSVSAI